MADQGSEGLLSPFLRKMRHRAISPYLQGNILNVGCDSGTLAERLSPDQYLGVEVDTLSLKKAQDNNPEHLFQKALPNTTNLFDTVVALAVIEHVKSPEHFLHNLSDQLRHTNLSRIIITTPHPSLDWIHTLSANAGLFSKHASDEHEELLDCKKLENAGFNAGLELIIYKRFLLGSNQLAVFKKKQ